MARPSKLTPEVQRIICLSLERSDPYNVAAAKAGIGVQTMSDWRAKGEEESAKIAEDENYQPSEDGQRYLDFYLAFSAADAAGESSFIEKYAAKARKGNARAIEFMLERRYSKNWGQKQSHQLSGPEGSSIKVDSSLAGLMSLIPAVVPDPEPETEPST